MSENARTKGLRLLTEGRLTVKVIRPDGLIQAICRGDSGDVYQLGYDPRGNGRWGCECPARGRCSHLIALQLVTVKPKTATNEEARQ